MSMAFFISKIFILLLFISSYFSLFLSIYSSAVLGALKRTFSCWTKDSLKLLYTVFVRPHLEYANSVCCPYLKQDIRAIERVQRRATNWNTWTTQRDLGNSANPHWHPTLILLLLILDCYSVLTSDTMLRKGRAFVTS